MKKYGECIRISRLGGGGERGGKDDHGSVEDEIWIWCREEVMKKNDEEMEAEDQVIKETQEALEEAQNSLLVE